MKPNYSLLAHDIKGAKPQCVKFQSTRQGIDPQDPQYNLPKFEARVPTPPHFIRDNVGVKDIMGAQPRRTWKGPEENPRKINVLVTEDIQGAQSK